MRDARKARPLVKDLHVDILERFGPCFKAVLALTIGSRGKGQPVPHTPRRERQNISRVNIAPRDDPKAQPIRLGIRQFSVMIFDDVRLSVLQRLRVFVLSIIETSVQRHLAELAIVKTLEGV